MEYDDVDGDMEEEPEERFKDTHAISCLSSCLGNVQMQLSMTEVLS